MAPNPEFFFAKNLGKGVPKVESNSPPHNSGEGVCPVECKVEDYYVILGVQNEASVRDITKAYRTLALKYHPDRNRDDTARAEDHFKVIAEAYRVLSNTTERLKYDLKTTKARSCQSSDTISSQRLSERTTSPQAMDAPDDGVDFGNLFDDQASFYHSWLRTMKAVSCTATTETSNSRCSSEKTTSSLPMEPSHAPDDNLDFRNLFNDEASFYHSWIRTMKPSSCMAKKEKSNSRCTSKRTTSPPLMEPSSALDDKLDSGSLFKDETSFYHSWIRTMKPGSRSATIEISNVGSATNAAKKRRNTSAESLRSNWAPDMSGATAGSPDDTDFDSTKSNRSLRIGGRAADACESAPAPVQLATARGPSADEKKHKWQKSRTGRGQPHGQVQGDAFEPSSAQPTPILAMSKGGQLMYDKKHQRSGLSSSKMSVGSTYRASSIVGRGGQHAF